MRSLRVVTVAVLLGGCGSCDRADVPVDAPVADALSDAVSDAAVDAAIDATICLPPAAGEVGGPCTTDAECDTALGTGDGLCLRGPIDGLTWPDQGYCVSQIGTCTDQTCGAGNQCAPIGGPSPTTACLPACAAGPCACAAGQLCARGFASTPLEPGRMACFPAADAAIDGDPCVSFGECAIESTCREEPLEYPGGQCQRVGCTVGDDTTCATGGDGHCVDARLVSLGVRTGTACVDACTVDGDCRIADGYRCVDGGAGVGRYCRHPQAGDACAIDADCGGAMLWDCKVGVTYPGGMCTPTTGCPTPGSSNGCSPGSSVCYDAVLPAVPTDNVCVPRCGGPANTQGGCRPGYACRDVAPGPGVTLGCVNP